MDLVVCFCKICKGLVSSFLKGGFGVNGIIIYSVEIKTAF